jgi:hypothetical protein
MADDRPQKRKRRHHPRVGPCPYRLLSPAEHPNVRQRRRDDRRRALAWVLVSVVVIVLLGYLLRYLGIPSA